MNLGEIVKNYRDQHSLTMDEFAERSGLSKGYISMLEKNKNPANDKNIAPSLNTIKKVADAIKVDFNELINMLGDNHEISLKSDLSVEESEEVEIKTIAAHAVGDLNEEQIKKIIEFAKFIKSQNTD